MSFDRHSTSFDVSCRGVAENVGNGQTARNRRREAIPEWTEVRPRRFGRGVRHCKKVMDLIAGMRLDDTAGMLKTGSCIVPWFPRPK